MNISEKSEYMCPVVSVIIPVYNVESYLRECIKSVINQTYNNLEIIIVDDGSNDGSERICDYYRNKDDRITVVHQANHGLSSARNLGLDLMNGDIVAFLDADDAYLPRMIEVMVESMKRESADIVVCGYYVCCTVKDMRADSYIVKPDAYKAETLNTKTALRRLLNDDISIFVWNKIFKKSLFNELRFEEGRVYEDQLIVPFLFETANRVSILNHPLVCYRQRPHSITTIHNERTILDWLYASKSKEHFITKRIPSVFSVKHKEAFLDKSLCGLILLYAAALSDHNDLSCKTKSIIEREIYKRANQLSHLSIKANVLYTLYKINITLCVLLLRLYVCVLQRRYKNNLRRKR